MAGKPKRDEQARYWVANVYEHHHSKETIERVLHSLNPVYVAWQKEQGENTDKGPHFNIYVMFDRCVRWSTLDKALPHSWFEPRKGKHNQALQYATKTDTRVEGPWTIGTEPKHQQGKRTDIIHFKRKILEGATDDDLIKDDKTFATMMKYHSYVPRVRLALLGTPGKRPELNVYVLWGEPGTGKSARATLYAEALNETPYSLAGPSSSNQTIWWHQYKGERVVIIDDYYGWIKYCTFLKQIDIYPVQVEFKGGSTYLLATHIIITSNIHPSGWYSFPTPAMMRRFTKVIKVTSLDQDIEDFPELPEHIRKNSKRPAAVPA